MQPDISCGTFTLMNTIETLLNYFHTPVDTVIYLHLSGT